MESSLRPIRCSEAGKAAIVFIHGFGGDIAETWQRFPQHLAESARLAGWDIWLLGYSTHLSVDVLGVWAADPGLDKLAARVASDVLDGTLARYHSVAVIAHSMGGLVVQRALVDAPELARRTSHVLLYGTPSGGLKKASLGWLLKPQLRHMVAGGDFVTRLRADWARAFAGTPQAATPFRFLAVAGERDEFVPASSSLGPFHDPARPGCTAVVPGNHVEMVKPEGPRASCVQLAVNTLCAHAVALGPSDAAQVAVELCDFQGAIAQMLPRAARLDRAARVQLAIALDRVGRRDEAVALLRDTGQAGSDTDAMGTLAGRIKRRWLVDRLDGDGAEALALYRQALALARAADDAAQAYYLGINVAFLQFAYADEPAAARTTAQQVLADCAAAGRADAETAEDRRWRLATEGEALLLLGQADAALARYREALATGRPPPWQTASMHLQAIHLAQLIGEGPLRERFDAVFRAPAGGAA